jgi:4-aminobutyrate aminotransferase-like enzyme
MNIVRTRWGANCFRMAPPLSVSTEEIDTSMEIIDQSLREVLAGV